MAKATAPEGGGVAIAKEKLSASARFYRRLGQYLDSDSMDAALLFKDSESDEIRTRFVVDVLSGLAPAVSIPFFSRRHSSTTRTWRGQAALDERRRYRATAQR